MTDTHLGVQQAQDVPTDADYWRFYDAVAARQLLEWLPPEPCEVLDVSGDGGRSAELAAGAGHRVTAVTASGPGAHPAVTWAAGERGDLTGPPGRTWDLVVALGPTLSRCPVTELTLERVRDALRPGGRLLLRVDSLTRGMARLAELGRWAELADIPRAEVVLVPEVDGTLVRCFWPEELTAVLTAVGFAVDWVRPRTVLSIAAVTSALRVRPDSLRVLVDAELRAAAQREGDATSLHLVASARRL